VFKKTSLQLVEKEGAEQDKGANFSIQTQLNLVLADGKNSMELNIKTVYNTRLGTMAGYVVKSGAVLRWRTSGDLTDRGSKSATVPSAETLGAILHNYLG
jgi:hypothetical protein